MYFKLNKYLVLLAFVSKCAHAQILCEPGFCREYRHDPGCPTNVHPHCDINNSTHQGLSLLSPSMCNCCAYCLPLYLEGEECSLGGPGDGVTVGRCGHGLMCIREEDAARCRRMTREHSECHGKQDDYDARHLLGLTGALEQRPLCDGKGKYAPAACIPTQTCFCQDEEGHRIFGEVLYQGATTIENMHCGCSRMNEKIRSLIGERLRLPVISLRCTADGNFNPVQCVGRECHCVDKITGIAETGPTVHMDKDHISELPCYDAELDLFKTMSPVDAKPPYNYTSPCYEDMKAKLDLILEYEEEGYLMDYYTAIQECLPDGTYGRIAMTRNRTKICVDETGHQIEDYEAEPNTEEFYNMDCKCAETSHLMSGAMERPICCKNGNYRQIQCRRGVCRCVDNDGRQEGLENVDVTKLDCYSENWKSC